MPDKKDHWNNIYKDKSSVDVSWYQHRPLLSLEFISQAHLASDEFVVDVGGGASRLVDCLCEEGYTNIAVLDISANAISSSQQRLGKKALEVEWFEQDIINFKPDHGFSLWHDRAVFHFLTEKSERNQYVDVLKQVLKPNGHLIIAAFATGGPEKCSGLNIVQYDAAKLQTELGEDFELVAQKNEVHVTPSNTRQLFGYYRFIHKN